MLVGAPTFATLLPQIHALLQDAVLVAHNARFDVGFLRHEWQLAGHTFPFLAVADTLALAQARYRFRHNSLGAIASELGVTPTALHRAMADVCTTWQVWQRFVADMRQEGPVILAHVLYPHSRRPMEDHSHGNYPRRLFLLASPCSSTTTGKSPRYCVVQPLEVYYERGHGYIRAFCYLRQEERHFRLDRIAELTVLHEDCASGY